jgi:hypothetical protein
MIGTQAGTGQLVITLCNYDNFQANRDTSGTLAGRKAGHERDSSGTNYKKDAIQSKKEYTPKPPRGADDFDAFWAEVPRKVAKGRARKAFAKAVKSTDPEIIIEAMKSHAEAMMGKDPQYIPHPSTWLNDERWADDGATDTRTFREKPQGEWTAKDREAAAMQWL